MYFTSLPDHSTPGFNEQSHFSMFGKANIIFNAESSAAHCDDHVGCLSIKTVLSGEEWYGINGRLVAVRPGQFLVLNDGQKYSCRIRGGERVKTVSVFFRRDLAAAVLYDSLNDDDALLDNPFSRPEHQPEFFQTLRNLDAHTRSQLSALVRSLEHNGYDGNRVDDHLIPLLSGLIAIQHHDVVASKKVQGIKSSTRKEIYRRLCIARDMMHSHYGNADLRTVGEASCLSIPQLIRQFKSVFGTTPHRYLVKVRLERAMYLMKTTDKPVQEIAWDCGFENASAFSRAFRARYGATGLRFRK